MKETDGRMEQECREKIYILCMFLKPVWIIQWVNYLAEEQEVESSVLCYTSWKSQPVWPWTNCTIPEVNGKLLLSTLYLKNPEKGLPLSQHWTNLMTYNLFVLKSELAVNGDAPK